MRNKEVEVVVEFSNLPVCVSLLEFFFSVFRVNEFNTKEFKRQVEKAKTCRELIQVLKVRSSSVDIIVLHVDRYDKTFALHGCLFVFVFSATRYK